jgi:nucleoid-associated protein YgaU
MDKLKIEVVHSKVMHSVLFNPEEYTENKDNKFATQEIPGLSGPLVQFVSGGQRTLDMELFFDSYEETDPEKRDIRKAVDQVVGLMRIDGELHAPPILNISWASLSMRCVLSRASQKFIMFDPDGKPVRARVTVTFSEAIDPEQDIKATNPQTADYTKIHTVIEGESLWSIANRHYDNPEAWRPIALANGLADPRALVIGQRLIVPSLPYTDALSGEVVR